MKKVAFYTLGCKVNQYETEAVAGIFQKKGYEIVSYEDIADIYVINTCTVTNLSDRKCRQVIRRAKKLNPDSLVAVMGCYSQVSPQEVSSIPDINIIIGTKDRDKLPDLCEEALLSNSEDKIINVGNSMTFREFEELGVETFKEHTRAFLKIQDGCTQFCSYCIIPYARGPVRSREPENIINEIKNLVDAGYKEFVLTGIHLASYGRDLKNTSLTQIISNVVKIDGVERVRLGSIEPGTLTDEFIDLVSSTPKMCRHYHVSLQSGSTSVLKRMNRKYTASEYYNRVMNLKERIEGVAITTDIIVGFPGETEEEFEETMRFAKKLHFSKIHVFKFSPRKGTPAADMASQIDNIIKEERSSRLIALSEKMTRKFIASHEGKEMMVLFEKYSGNSQNSRNYIEGHTDNYIKVICRLPDDMKNTIEPGFIAPVIIKEVSDDHAEGILIK